MNALYIAWKLDRADAATARRTRNRLTAGEKRSLYRLQSWSIANGEARALLDPTAPLDRIAEAIWRTPSEPVFSRWIEGDRACAAAAIEIETGAGPQCFSNTAEAFAATACL